MSKDDPHPIIKWAAEHNDGYNEQAHGEFDHDHFAAYQAYKSILHKPAERMQALNDLDAAIGANDGTSMRAKAQLFDLRKKLGVVHARLCKFGK
jgi:hypothetical protein